MKNKIIIPIKTIREMKDAEEFNSKYSDDTDITSFFNYHGTVKESLSFKDSVLIKKPSLLRIILKSLF